MARGTTLTNLRAMLKRELRDASESNDWQDTLYNGLLATKLSDLCNAYDWDFLERNWDLACAIGSRYLSIPTTTTRSETSISINFERPVHVDRFFNNFYAPVLSDIDMELFNWRNSDLDQRQDPIMRWQMVSNVGEAANASQVEIWPIPVTAQVLRFTGQRVPLALTSESHTADLDDALIVYGVAMEELALRDQKLVQPMALKFQSRLQKLRAAYQPAESFVLGQNQLECRRSRLVNVRIAVAGGITDEDGSFIVTD